MITIYKNLAAGLICTGLILIAGCAGNTPSTTAAPVQNQPPAQTNSTLAGDPKTTGAKPTAEPVNRVDVIYFHVNQRCVTCLCFEEHVNNVIDKYFGNDIASGKLTYRVLNAQLPQNAAIAQKYGVVGSQLFINTISNGVDNIENISKIWDWNCRNNPQGFELKVKNTIEARLNVQG